MIDIASLNEQEILSILPEGTPKYNASQIFAFIQNGKSFDEMTSLKKELRAYLSQNYIDIPLKIKEIFTSKDGSKKLLYELADGNLIEGVFMPHNYGDTLCVSTQVGCPMGCVFCASGLNGLVRNLTPGEILAQVILINKLEGGNIQDRKITNIVLMGSGEPLANYDNVIKFFALVNDKKGLNISLRNISLSTCGIVDKIKDLADSPFHPTLSISLHAPNDELRKTLMPIANKVSIKDLIDATKYYFEKTGRRIIFEYSMIKGVNDSIDCAKQLAKITSGYPTHINLIRLNDVKEKDLKGSNQDTIKTFIDTLERHNTSVTLRRSFGNDIEGACGQLRARFINDKIEK